MSQQINLFNPVFMNQRKYFSTVAMLQALLLIVLGSVLFYAYAAYQVRSLKSQSADADKRYIAEQARLEHYSEGLSPQESNRLLADEVKDAEAKLSKQHEIIETLKSGAIGNTTGFSEYMSAFARQAVNGLWLTGFDITGDATQISINGAVLSPELLPTYIRKLDREPIMRGKTFAALQMRREEATGRYVEFTLQSVESEGNKAR